MNNYSNNGYQPNHWLTSDLQRRIVTAARQFHDYTLLLRPTRRNIFLRMFRLPEGTYAPDFFKACFGVLAKANDPDKKPCLVIETEDPGPEIRNLYEKHGVLWVLIRQEENRFALDCAHGGTILRIEERTGSLFKLLSSPLAWCERNMSFPQGSYVHSHSERILREAVGVLSPSYRIEAHHQVPLAYVLGYKEDLSAEDRGLLGSEMDAVIIQSFDADPDGAVVLPVKLDVHDSHRQNERVSRRDSRIREVCDRFGVPLLVISPAGDGAYAFECSRLDLPRGAAEVLDPHAWAGALAPFLGAAIRYAGRGF